MQRKLTWVGMFSAVIVIRAVYSLHVSSGTSFRVPNVIHISFLDGDSESGP